MAAKKKKEAPKPPSPGEMERFFRRMIMRENATQTSLMSLADGQEQVVYSWDLPKDIGEFDLQGTLDDVYAYAQKDTDGLGQPKNYVLVAEDKDREPCGRSLTFEMWPTEERPDYYDGRDEPEDEEPEEDDEEDEDEEEPGYEDDRGRGRGRLLRRGPPELTPEAQVIKILQETQVVLIKHLEQTQKMMTLGVSKQLEMYERTVGRLSTQNENMSAKHGEQISVLEDLKDRRQERDLEIAREKKKDERIDEVLDAVKQLAPLVGMKLLPAHIAAKLPGANPNRDRRIDVLNEFLAGIDVDKVVPALAKVLTHAQMAAFMGVFQAFQEGAIADEAAKNGGAPPTITPEPEPEPQEPTPSETH